MAKGGTCSPGCTSSSQSLPSWPGAGAKAARPPLGRAVFTAQCSATSQSKVAKRGRFASRFTRLCDAAMPSSPCLRLRWTNSKDRAAHPARSVTVSAVPGVASRNRQSRKTCGCLGGADWCLGRPGQSSAAAPQMSKLTPEKHRPSMVAQCVSMAQRAPPLETFVNLGQNRPAQVWWLSTHF